ncbi:MAG: isoprenylcysteine carboxylmethyltransferase family protein [Bacteroidales bacterium]|nr:isoprenylcysteine carboxylmethyltransferase family protein [Bacteroidales bacterium]
MNGKLFVGALVKAVVGFVLMAALLFLPAGTLHYSGGWLFLGVLFIPMLLFGTVLFVKSPELLRRRLDAKEKRSAQKDVVEFSGLIFILTFIVAGLDFRYGWSDVPDWVRYSAAVLFLLGYVLYAEVMRENMWLSRSVKVEQGQQVITTGLYGVVRHPMYSATLLMFLPIPLILGSWWGVLVMWHYVLIIKRRILDEEKLLRLELKGYSEYCDKIPWRLIPYLW